MGRNDKESLVQNLPVPVAKTDKSHHPLSEMQPNAGNLDASIDSIKP